MKLTDILNEDAIRLNENTNWDGEATITINIDFHNLVGSKIGNSNDTSFEKELKIRIIHAVKECLKRSKEITPKKKGISVDITDYMER